MLQCIICIWKASEWIFFFSSFTHLAYTPAAQHLNINCTNNTYFIQDTFDGPNKTKLSCKFTSDMLQNCSGITDPTFGFPEGKPCFIIKMNRVSTSSRCWAEKKLRVASVSAWELLRLCCSKLCFVLGTKSHVLFADRPLELPGKSWDFFTIPMKVK